VAGFHRVARNLTESSRFVERNRRAVTAAPWNRTGGDYNTGVAEAVRPFAVSRLDPRRTGKLPDVVQQAETEGRGEIDDNDLPTSPPHPLIIAVSTAARGGLLWLCAAAVLTWRGHARLAVRGVLAGGCGMAVSHALAPLVGRRRPRARDLPARRALPERPSSASFPSKHATTAAAFATAVALERPSSGLWAMPLAAIVCYSRPRTRAHWPSDVYGGAALGVLIAVALRRSLRRLG